MTREHRTELRRFGLGVGAILLAFATLAWLAWFPFDESHPRAARVLAGVGGLLGVTGAAAPRALDPVYRVWMPVAHAIGWFNTRVLLAVVYYGILLPTGLLRRLAKDPLALRAVPADSYWVPREPREGVESYRRQV